MERELEKTKKSTLHSYTDNDDLGQDVEETHLKNNPEHKNKSRLVFMTGPLILWLIVIWYFDL